jgi:hypothetical protein
MLTTALRALFPPASSPSLSSSSLGDTAQGAPLHLPYIAPIRDMHDVGVTSSRGPRTCVHRYVCVFFHVMSPLHHPSPDPPDPIIPNLILPRHLSYSPPRHIPFRERHNGYPLESMGLACYRGRRVELKKEADRGRDEKMRIIEKGDGAANGLLVARGR